MRVTRPMGGFVPTVSTEGRAVIVCAAMFTDTFIGCVARSTGDAAVVESGSTAVGCPGVAAGGKGAVVEGGSPETTVGDDAVIAAGDDAVRLVVGVALLGAVTAFVVDDARASEGVGVLFL